MSVRRRSLLLGSLGAFAAPALPRAAETTPIRIGEINSYTAAAAFTLPYRNGWQLAVEQINAAGGVLGRPLEVLSRDDAGQPQNALRLAGELVNDQKVDLLAGGYLSNVGLALADFALQQKCLFIAGEPLTDTLVWDKGNRYTWRLRPSTYMQAAMLLDDAARLPAKRWATVSPNYEYGQSAVKWFKKLLSARRPDVTFVAEQWPPLGKIDAGATVQALVQAKPDAIFNVTFGADLTAFVRQGNTAGLFEGKSVVSVLTGEPEYLATLGDETPPGWIVTGYPWDQDHSSANQKFVDAYRARFKEDPRMGSVVGYALIAGIAAGITKTGKVATEAMADGFAGARFATPFGQVMWRGQDHQSTLGTYVGKLAVANGQGRMVDWHYVDGASALPSDDEVRSLRPAG
jgi:branched-chain amino acid transport system substrate-binding protein